MMQKQQIASIIFFYIVKNLEIPKYIVEDDMHLNMNSHPIFKAVFKYIIQVLFLSGVFVIKFKTLIFLASIKIQF